jgi:IclR family transcriptional regulator, acetate operon repressor
MAAPPSGPRPCPGTRNTASGKAAGREARPAVSRPVQRTRRTQEVLPLSAIDTRIPLLWTARRPIFARAKGSAGRWRDTVSKIVERTLDFLELFAREKRPLSLSDISRLLSIPVSSRHDVLQALQERGFIYEIAPRGGYYPTLRLYELGKSITENDPVVHRAELVLRELRDALDETVLLAKVTGLSGIYLLNFDSSQPLRFQLRPGETIKNLHATSDGLALLATLDERRLRDAMERMPLVPLTRNTPKTAEELCLLIDAGRSRGYYVNPEYSIEGLTALSGSFSWQQSFYIVTIAGPTARLSTRIEVMAPLLLNACRRLEMRNATC